MYKVYLGVENRSSLKTNNIWPSQAFNVNKITLVNML